jgi:hypothetical protein
MKTILSILSISIIMATACNTKPEPNLAAAGTVAMASDTAGFAEFKAFHDWKTQQDKIAVPEAKMKTKIIYVPAPAKTGTVNTNSSNNSVGTTTSETSNEVKTTEKKGWSKAAKGAAIGAGSGAVLGAVINKRNRAVGAAVGGVVGGGVGYGIGRAMDKKDGRY